jgi:hypothetical protein
MKNNILKWLIIAIDAIFLFNFHWFFTVASTAMNYLGVLLIILLIVLTIKIFKK